jgi:hypothetical protein
MARIGKIIDFFLGGATFDASVVCAVPVVVVLAVPLAIEPLA